MNLTCIIYEEAGVPSRDSAVRSPPYDALSLFSHNTETIYINKLNGSSLLFLAFPIPVRPQTVRINEFLYKTLDFSDSGGEFKSFCVALFYRFIPRRGRRTTFGLRPPLTLRECICCLSDFG